MPQYYFHVRDKNDFAEDLEGEAFADVDAALGEAFEVARELLAERVRTARPVRECTIELADESGHLIHAVPLMAALK